MPRTEVTPFVNRQRPSPAQKRRPARVRAASMMTKIGLCGGICLLALGMYLAGTKSGQRAVLADAEAVSRPPDAEELGKLHFVQLPGIAEVFAPDQGLLAPCSVPAVLEEEGCVACFCPDGEEAVRCGGNGSVRSLGSDPLFGDYVRLALEDGREIIYYGLQQRTVETGQPLRTGDTLGTVGAGQTLRLAVLENGRPQPVTEQMTLTLLR